MAEVAYIIGNGPSRRDVMLDTLPGTTFGCNALYRDYAPDYLLSGDSTIIKEICETEYPKNNKCIFPDFDCVPMEMKDMIVTNFDPKFNVKESDLDRWEHCWIFGLEDDISNIMEVHVIGVNPEWQIQNMKGTEEDPRFSVNFFAGSQAMAQASIMGFDEVCLVGFDSIWDFQPDTYQNIYAGTNAYKREKETSRLRVGTGDPNSLLGTQEAQILKVIDKFKDVSYTIYYNGNKKPLTYNSFI
jgi:hypothetical protein|tara:strand:- start:74 stop:802 length:729 start_codon:yes stop_codon:yes gene_type:complete